MAQEESQNTAAERVTAQPTPRRNASLDILRIVAMAFIVLLHLVQNNIGLNSVKTDSQAISVNLFLPASSVACVAVIGVNLFFLLSGYFGIKAKPSKVFSLIFKVYILWIISTFLGMAFGTLHFGSFVEWFFFVGKAITKYWFIIVYILLCIASPFLNAFAEKLAQGGGQVLCGYNRNSVRRRGFHCRYILSLLRHGRGISARMVVGGISLRQIVKT